MTRDGMVLITTRRRMLPPDPEPAYPGYETEGALRMSCNVLEDSASMHNQSRRQDRKLLNDITQRLVSSETPRVKRNRNNQSIAIKRVTAKPKNKSTPKPVASGLRRRTRISRSLSPIPTYKPFTPPVAHKQQPRVVKNLHAASVDQAVRRAKHALDSYERDIEMPPLETVKVSRALVTSRTPGKRGARYRSTPRRSLSPPTRRYASTPVRKVQHDVPYASTYYSDSSRGRDLLSIRAKLEAMQEPLWPTETYKDLRSRATDARNRLDVHKGLMDRYLPTDFAPGNEVSYEVDRKYDELAYRMPELQANLKRFTYGNPHAAISPSTGRRAQSVPPMSHSTSVGRAARAPSVAPCMPRPQMSEARRRAREVLCKTKKDPTYFS